ncbi:MAG: stage V sporulation protein B [Peptococcales bacterium]|jgi:stage V sporulation protein B
MSKQSFVQGALILFIAGIFVKFAGFIFQIIVIRIIGTEAVGLYNMIFPLYITAIVLSTAGLPLAISKMVSHYIALGSYRAAIRVFKVALSLIIILSLTFTLLLVIISPMLIKTLYKDPRVVWCFYAMVPGIIIVPICSAFRGFFQGLQDMVPPAFTQCIEQITRITIAIFLITTLKPYGIKIVAVGLSLSMIIGELFGLFTIYILYKLRRRKLRFSLGKNEYQKLTVPTKKIITELFKFGFPATLTRLISSLVLTFEASLIPISLQKSGFTINQAASIYGQFSGVSMTLLTIPTVLTFSLATSLLPAISEAEAQGKFAALQFRSTESLRLTYLFGLPMAIILLLKATSLSNILFNLPEAGTTIRFLAWGAIFLYLAQTSNGILQGLGLVDKVLINTIIGSCIKLLGIIYLVKIPELNINGAAVAFVLSFLIICILNLSIIHKATGFRLKIKQIILPFIAVLFMGGIIIIQTKYYIGYFSEVFTTITSISVGLLLYFILIIIFKQFSIKQFLQQTKK